MEESRLSRVRVALQRIIKDYSPEMKAQLVGESLKIGMGVQAKDETKFRKGIEEDNDLTQLVQENLAGVPLLTRQSNKLQKERRERLLSIWEIFTTQ